MKKYEKIFKEGIFNKVPSKYDLTLTQEISMEGVYKLLYSAISKFIGPKYDYKQIKSSLNFDKVETNISKKIPFASSIETIQKFNTAGGNIKGLIGTYTPIGLLNSHLDSKKWMILFNEDGDTFKVKILIK